MNVQERIQQLQSRRHRLLDRRAERGAPIASLDLELNVVRSELIALYEMQRERRIAPRLAS
ncbi:hypothetical protein [Acidithiobacillus sp. AMEEHan]|uniref:hypothetical protein n=1 Tax=Acidithiobacillus sp. AMEEHan TaxID=2994951 RepID=UPI0027E43AEA|nr:hypothetical protein [Acidithiobacillus sp. AMEEHan]